MNCEDYQQLVSKLLDNSLEKGKTADVFRHLGECDECRAFFGTSMHLRHAMQSAPPMQATESVDRKVLGFADSRPRVVSSAPPSALGSGNHATRISFSTVALAVLVLVIGCVLFSTSLSVDNRGTLAGPIAPQLNQLNGAR